MKKNILFSAIVLLLLVGCNKEEFVPYDHPFVHIHVNNQEEVRVPSNRKETVEYPVFLSTALRFESVYVDYDIVVGSGLKEGVDFNILTENRTLHFPAGVFNSSVAIQWLQNPVDPQADNTLTIRLLKTNDEDITIGLPGPDHKQSKLIITKY